MTARSKEQPKTIVAMARELCSYLWAVLHPAAPATRRARSTKNRDLAVADVADCIVVFYNQSRCHGHLGGVSPEQFESAHKVRRQGVR